MSTTRKNALFSLWEHFDFNLDSLSERIRLQKTVYILAKLKYPILTQYLKDFSMYIHGPYSTTLAKDAYELDDDSAACCKHKLSKEEKSTIKLFDVIVGQVRGEGTKVPEYINCELISDIIYFYTNNCVTTDRELFQNLISKKSYFNDVDKFEAAVSVLRERNII